jgi:hypothetical protein
MLLIKNEIQINFMMIAIKTIQVTIKGFILSQRYQMRYLEDCKLILSYNWFLRHHNSELTPVQLFCLYKVVLNCLGFLKTWLVTFLNHPE